MKESKGIGLVVVGILGELGILYFIHQSMNIDATIASANIKAENFFSDTSVNMDVWNIIQTQGYMNFVILFAIIIFVGLYMCITGK